MEKDTFILKANHYKMFRNRLTQEQKGHLLDAIFCDQLGESVESHTADPLVGMVFDMIQDFYQQCNEAYQEKCERNRENIRKRWNKQNDTENTTEYDSIQPNTSVKSVIHSESESDTESESESKSKPKSKSDLSKKENISFLEQKDKILEIFFFNNFEYPEEELERFYAFYESKGWEEASGRKIKNIVSRAKLWKQEEDRFARYTDQEMIFLRMVYNKTTTPEEKSIILHTGKIEQRIASSSTHVWDIYHTDKSGMTAVLTKYGDKSFLPQNVEYVKVV